MKKILFLGVSLTISISLLLSGCGKSNITKIETVTTEVEKQNLNIDPPRPLELDNVNWIVVTENNFEEVFTNLKLNGTDPVLFAITDNGYESLSVDFLKIRQHIDSQRTIILAYKSYYEKTTLSPSD